jgi:hypothetical protein
MRNLRKTVQSVFVHPVLISAPLAFFIATRSVTADGPLLPLFADGVGLRAENGAVEVLDASGTPLLRLDGLDGSWAPYRTDGGSVERIGDDAVRVTYRMTGAAASNVSASATFTCRGRRVEALYHLSGSTNLSVGGAMILRRAVDKRLTSRLLKQGLWQRHAGGGTAVETDDGVFRRTDTPAATVLEEIRGNPNWSNARAQHAAFARQTGSLSDTSERQTESLSYTASTVFHVLPPGGSDAEAAARARGRPFALELSTDAPFNLSTNGVTPLTLTGQISNTQTGGASDVEASLTVRDFDGAVTAEKRLPVTLAAGASLVLTVTVPPATGVSFAELRIHDADGREWFERTTLGAVQPYTFAHRDRSIFGIAASFPQPSRADVEALLRRMGVRWVRRGDTRETLPSIGAVANHHCSFPPTKWIDEPDKREAELRKILAECDQRENPFLEFGNEWNMSALNTGKTADTYVNDWLKPLARLRGEGGFKVGLLSMGLAGADTAYLKAIHAHGGWPLLDGVAFHPGRSNFTPDHDAPGWTYLGAIRRMRQAVAAHGEKPLWATEAYACTLPHSSWHDTPRRAAENVVLTYALGLAEGLKAVMFYQLQDGTWHDVGGIDLKDAEYHYGLLDRKNAVKPSLLAYCAAAEALDGAVFRHYVNIERWRATSGRATDGAEAVPPSVRGILFDTPRGPLAVLWDRTEGFVQSKRTPGYVTPEPWTEHWKSRIAARFEADGPRVTVIDCVGRRRTVEARDGAVTLELTGAPLMVYGLTPTLRPVSETAGR